MMGAPLPEAPARRGSELVEDVVLPPAACRDWLGFLREGFSSSRSSGRVEREEGVALHAVLAGIGALSEPSWGEQVASAVRAVEGERDLPDGILDRVRAFVSSGGVRPFFFLEGGEVFTEKEFVDRTGRVRRMDRVIVTAGEVRVVDFKREAMTPEAEAQMQAYREILKEVFPGRRVRGFLIRLRDGHVEERPWEV